MFEEEVEGVHSVQRLAYSVQRTAYSVNKECKDTLKDGDFQTVDVSERLKNSLFENVRPCESHVCIKIGFVDASIGDVYQKVY